MKILLTIVLVSVSLQSHAAISGDTLKEWCDSDVEACARYAGGVNEGSTNPDKSYCVEDISYLQAANAVSKYLKKHPALLHEDAYLLVRAALTDAFPCKGE